MPISDDGTSRFAIWIPITAPTMPSAASIKMMPNSTGTTGCTAFNMTRPPRQPLFDQRRLPALQQSVCDDQALDLAGALPDPFHAQLAIEALGDVLAHVAAAAEDLDSAVGDAVRHLPSVELHHRALGVADFHVFTGIDRLGGAIDHQARGPQPGQAVGPPELDPLLGGELPTEHHAVPGQRRDFVDQPRLGGAIDHQARGPQLGQAVGQHELDPLLVGELLTEHSAVLGEGGDFVDQPRCGAAATRADHQALIAEPVAGEAHAVAFLADAV